MYLHSKPGHLSVLCGLLDDLCQLMASLVVAEEVESGASLNKRANPDVWWPRAVSNHCCSNMLELALKSLIKIFSQCDSGFQFSMMSGLHQLLRNK